MRPSHYRIRQKVDLTPRQRQVLELVARGKTNPEIAEVLGITLDGAKFHVSEILDRLGVSTREEAAARWREQNGVRGRLTGVLSLVLSRWVAVGSITVVGAALVAVAAILTWPGRHTTDMPAPSDATAVGTPAAPGGRRVILAQSGESGGSTVLAVDPDDGRVLSQFSVALPARVFLAPDGLFLADSEGLKWTRPDGTGTRVIFRPSSNTRVGMAAASPDGETVAVTTNNDSGGGSIVFLDFADGRVLREVPVTAETWPGFVGSPSRLQWRDDGTGVVVKGATGSERPGSVATVFKDGTVNVARVQAFGTVSPDGRLYGYNAKDRPDDAIIGCMTVATHTIAILDLTSGDIVASVRDPASALVRYFWAPDGSAFLYSSQHSPDGQCPGIDAETNWFLLPRNSNVPEPMADIDSLFEQWYGNTLVSFACNGVGQPMQTNTYGQSAGDCPESGDTTARVGGRPVATALSFVSVGTLGP